MEIGTIDFVKYKKLTSETQKVENHCAHKKLFHLRQHSGAQFYSQQCNLNSVGKYFIRKLYLFDKQKYFLLTFISRCYMGPKMY